MGREASVEIRDLSKSFGITVALRGISLSIARGEFVSFLGPSGCGKTTLLRTIAGLETPTSGSILIAGRDVARDPPYRRDIGLVFQNYALFPHKSVAANVRFGLRYRTGLPSPERERIIERVLALVRLSGFEGRQPAQLSGGQQQRVALARAIATHPEVLLLDEPLSNLDAKLRDDMRVELKDLHRTLGMTFVYVTHDRAEALSMSDRIAVLRDGAVDQYGAPREVFERPASIQVARFMGHDNLLKAIVRGTSEGLAIVEVENTAMVGAAAPPSVKVGAPVWLLVRNNAVKLHLNNSRDGQIQEHLLRARIASILFQGLQSELQLVLPSSARLRVELPSYELSGLDPNAEVLLHVVSSGTWILDRTEE